MSAATIGSKVREVLVSDTVTPRKVERLLAGIERGELRTPEGGTVLAITGSPMGTEGGSVLSIRDVSERARLERMKDEFVLTASHELRSPLTSVQGFAELLMLERDDLSDKHAETVEIILDNTRHLVRLLNDLLDLARSDAGRLTINPPPVMSQPATLPIPGSVRHAASAALIRTNAMTMTVVTPSSRQGRNRGTITYGSTRGESRCRRG